MFIEKRRGSYLISTDPARLDARVIHAYLTQSYWAAGIPLDVVERAIRGSLCIGLYDYGQMEIAQPDIYRRRGDIEN